MNIENVIRERHAFEDKVKKFLDLASVVNERELEVALGRLVDMLTKQGYNNIHIQLRGEILKHYYDLRKRGEKKYRPVRRAIGPWPIVSETLIQWAST